MQETIDLGLKYLRMIWRFRWLVLITAIVGSGAGWAFVISLPNQFEVSSRVFLDTRSMLRPLLQGLAINTSVARDTALLMRRTLLVRPNLEQVARKTDMDLEAKTPAAFEQLLDKLARDISLSGTARDNIFVIRYKSSDPKLATRVVESLLNIFVEQSLGDTRKDTSKTRQFLEKQIAEYEARLDAAEERRKEFKRRNVGLMPGSGSGYYAKLQQVSEAFAAAKLQLDEAKRRRDELVNRLDSVDKMIVLEAPAPPSQAMARQAPMSREEQRVATLQAQLDQLLMRYTEQHPDVKELRVILEEAVSESDAAQAEAADSAPADPEPKSAAAQKVENPMFQQLTVSLSQAEGEVAAMEARVDEYDRRREKLKELVDTVPQVEAELQRLDRDYNIVKNNFTELTKRREGLKLSDDAEQTSEGVKFKILEPPRVPLVPAGPDRPKMSAGVLGAGLAAGVGLALLVAMLRPSVYTRSELETLTGLPVIGSVSRLWTNRERWRRRMEIISFAGGTAALFGLFGGLLTLYSLQVDIAAKAVSFAQKIL